LPFGHRWFVNNPKQESIDWREKRAVTPVKHQGFCGSCWAFTSIAAIEGAYAIKQGKAIEFSEQQTLDCVNKKLSSYFYSLNCKGGYPEEMFEFGKKHTLALKKFYPYKGVWGEGEQCR